MQQLKEIRNKAGPRWTQGLPDAYIEHFLILDGSLSYAIRRAHENWKKLDGKESYEKGEKDMIHDIFKGWTVFYPEGTRNPYVPLAASGPWIVTVHGAVLHDNGGYGMLGLGHGPEKIIESMSENLCM